MPHWMTIAAVTLSAVLSSAAVAGPSYDRTPQRQRQLAGGRAAPQFVERGSSALQPYALTGVSRAVRSDDATWSTRLDRKGNYRIWRAQPVRVVSDSATAR